MAWHDSVYKGIVWPVAAGVLALLLGFGGFGTWAALAPLQGAVVAPGTVVASGQNKVVQHLEGGLVKEILAEEGEQVTMGEPLLILDETASEANLERLKAQLATIEAAEARALAERNGAEKIIFPETLLNERTTPEVAEAIADQQAEFQARLEKHRAELAVFEQQIAALREAIAGHEAQNTELANELALLEEERNALEDLLEKGLTTRTRVNELRRREADLRGRRAQLTAEIAEAKKSIAEIEEQMERTRGTRLEEASARLADLRLRRSQLLQEVRAAQDITDRIVVRSPASGTVINLMKHNPGAVITPGQAIMEIVPRDSELLVEAQVRPQDIDEVGVGQSARLHFAAFDRDTPPVPGEVIHVSADRLENERTGEPYYLARLRISSQRVGGFNLEDVGPGQPVEVFITTGERTFATYVLDPILKTLRRSFLES